MEEYNEINELYKEYLQYEIERIEHHMYNVLKMDKEKVEESYKLLDTLIEKGIKEHFDNLAEYGE